MMLQNFASACLNSLRAGDEATALASNVEAGGGPMTRYDRLSSWSPRLHRSGPDPRAHRRRGRADLVRALRKEQMKRGVDFFAIQQRRGGYHVTVRGPKEKLGDVVVTHLDEAAGRRRFTRPRCRRVPTSAASTLARYRSPVI